jgi:hypothetical protein
MSEGCTPPHLSNSPLVRTSLARALREAKRRAANETRVYYVDAATLVAKPGVRLYKSAYMVYPGGRIVYRERRPSRPRVRTSAQESSGGPD